jgi:aryl-alcohol dehydrogenase-like predicted oxidoreductase
LATPIYAAKKAACGSLGGRARILPKKSVKHLGENLKAATLQLPPEIIANLNSIGENPKQ